MDTQTLLIALIVILTLAVIALFILIFIVLFKSNLLKRDQQDSVEDSKVKDHHSVTEQYTCFIHEKQNAIATCAICENAVCEDCHKDWDGLHLCPEHFGLYSKHSWIEIAEIRTTPQEPEKGHKLYHFKQSLWNDDKTPTYLVTHYKIDVDGDFVESWVKLYAREEEADHLLNRFKVHEHQ
tara:strand:- start:2761 stop:3303 length:543 start_codon:yes stop_codon:yes gene_type:complete